MNNIRDISPIEQDALQQGVNVLQARRNKMQMFTVLSSMAVLASLVILVFNQSLVYAFFEISTTVQQLHIPIGALGIEQYIGQNPDYFGRLFSWVMWLGLKIIVSIIGATILVYYLKRIKFFRIRMSNFGKRFLAWSISFGLLWIAVAAVQSEMMDGKHQNENYAEFVAYKNHINQSEIYQYLQYSTVDPVTQDYLLAQTALLHKDIDKNIALAYTAKLIQAEKQDPQFMSYGFKPEQLWAMQHQLYGKAITPLAQSIENQVITADRIVNYSQWLWLISLVTFLVFTFIFYGLTRQFNQRLIRIETQLK